MRVRSNQTEGILFSQWRRASGDRVASGSNDGTVQIWHAPNGHKIGELKGPSARACVVFSPDGTHILASTPDKAVYVWDLEKQAEVRTLRGHKASVWSIAFNPTGTRVVTAGADRVTRLWTWPDCEEILSLPLRDLPGLIAFVGDGKKLVTAGLSGVTVWDAAPGPVSHLAKE